MSTLPCENHRLSPLYYCRYRPLDVTEDKSVVQELENQEIYLVTREKLNDPTEALPLFSWGADAQNWAELLEHYLLSLASAWSETCSYGTTLDIDSHIRVEQSGYKYPESYYAFVKKISGSEIKKLPAILGETGVISTEVVVFLFYHCQWKIMDLLLEWHIETGGCHNIEIPDDLLVIDFELIRRVFTNDDKSGLLKLSKIPQLLDSKMSLFEMSNNCPVKTTIFRQLLLEFPRRYFECIGKKRSDTQFRLASFFKTEELPNNFLMWSHYADSHEGICLIFEAPNVAGKDPLLRLESSAAESVALKEVNYGRPPNPSPNAFDAVDASSLEARARFKLRVWEKENEYRIIESGSSMREYVKYDFNALHGIVFGVNTPEAIKMELTRVIRSKCKKQGRAKFSLYQMFLSSEDGALSAEKIMDNFSS